MLTRYDWAEHCKCNNIWERLMYSVFLVQVMIISHMGLGFFWSIFISFQFQYQGSFMGKLAGYLADLESYHIFHKMRCNWSLKKCFSCWICYSCKCMWFMCFCLCFCDAFCLKISWLKACDTCLSKKCFVAQVLLVLRLLTKIMCHAFQIACYNQMFGVYCFLCKLLWLHLLISLSFH